MPTATSELQVLITARDEASAKIKGLGSSLAAASTAAGIAGAAILGFLAIAAKKASDAEIAMQRVNTTLVAAGANAAAKRTILETAKANQRLGFDSEATANSLAEFFARTKDVNQALELNAIAMNLARRESTSIEDATSKLTLAIGGNERLFRKYNLAVTKSMTTLEKMRLLQKSLGPAAEDASHTFQVQMLFMKLAADDAFRVIGTAVQDALIPFVQWITRGILAVTAFAEAHPVLIPILTKVALTLGIVLVAVKLLTAAWILLKLVMSPLGAGFILLGTSLGISTAAAAALAIGLAILAVAIITIWKNWDVVGPFLVNFWVNLQTRIFGIWEEIKSQASRIFPDIVRSITGIWEDLKLIAQWLGIDESLRAIWKAISAVASTIWSGIVRVINDVWAGLVIIDQWLGISEIVRLIWSELVLVAKATGPFIVSFFTDAWADILRASELFGAGMDAIIRVAFSIISKVFTVALEEIEKNVIAAWEVIKAVSIAVWPIIVAFLSGTWDAIVLSARVVFALLVGMISGNWELMRQVTTEIWTGIKNFFFGIWDAIVVKVTGAMGFVLAKVVEAKAALDTILQIAATPIRTATRAITTFVRATARQGGGPVSAGNPFIVGEHGAELFVPDRGGRIIPRGGFGGGMTVNITITGNSFMSDERTAISIGDMIVDRLKLVSKLSL